MNTQLFIKYPKYEIPKFDNLNFSNEVKTSDDFGWTFTQTIDITNNTCYINNAGSLIKTNFINNITTKYKISFEIIKAATETDGYVEPSGSLTISLGNVSKTKVASLGIHSYIIDMTANVGTVNLTITSSNQDFKRGIRNIQIECIENEIKEIELFNGINIPLNYNIQNVTDISKKNASYSKTITVPGTPTNNKVFKHIYNISSDNAFYLNVPVQCYIEQNSHNIFDGHLLLDKINIESDLTYEVVCISNNFNIFQQAGTKKITNNENVIDNISMSEWDHFLTRARVEEFTKRESNGFGYVYGFIDKQNRWGNNAINPSIFYVDEMTPAVFVRELFIKILTKYGYTYTSDFIDSEMFRKLIIPSTNPKLYITEDYLEKLKVTAENTYFNTLTTVCRLDEVGIKNTFTEMIFQEEIDVFDQFDLTYYTAKEGGTFDITYNPSYHMNITIPQSPGSGQYWCILAAGSYLQAQYEIIKVSNGIETILTTYTKQVPFTNLPGTCSIDWSSWPHIPNDWHTYVRLSQGNLVPLYSNTANITVTANIIEGDIIYIKKKFSAMMASGYYGGSDNQILYRYNTNGNNNEFNRYQYPDEITLNRTFNEYTPDGSGKNKLIISKKDNFVNEGSLMTFERIFFNIDLTQADFLKGIIAMFNLYIDDTNGTNLIIEPRDEYFAKYSEIVNWTDLEYTLKQTIIERPNDLPDQIFNLTYTDDVDDFNKLKYKDLWEETYGNYSVKGYNSNLDESKKSEIKVIFSPTLCGPLTKYSKLYCPKIFKTKEDKTVDITQKYKPRILFRADSSTVTTPFSLISNDVINYPTPVTFPTYFPWSHFDNIGTTSNVDLNFGKCNYYFDKLLNGVEVPLSKPLFDKYYYNHYYQVASQGSRLVTKYFKLTTKDISKFKFSNVIQIKNDFFVVNKIIDFVSDTTVKVELLKILDNITVDITKYKKPPVVIDPEIPIQTEYLDLIDAVGVTSYADALNCQLIDSGEATGNGRLLPTRPFGQLFIDLIDSKIDQPWTNISTIAQMKSGWALNDEVNILIPFIE